MKNVKIILMALAVIGIIVGGPVSIAESDTLSASFLGDVNTGAAPLTIHFTDTSEGSPTSWQWDFGDGSYSTLQNPVYTYNQPGTYTVTLTVSDGAQSDTMSGDVVVTNSRVVTPTPSTTPVIVYPVPVRGPHHGQPPHDVDRPHKKPVQPDNPVHKDPVKNQPISKQPVHKQPVNKPTKEPENQRGHR